MAGALGESSVAMLTRGVVLGWAWSLEKLIVTFTWWEMVLLEVVVGFAWRGRGSRF